MAKTLQQTIAKWQANATGAEQAWVDGIQNTTEDPTALAAANAAGALAGYTAAINSGFWARQLQAAGRAKWQGNSVAKRSNYSSGIAAGTSAYSQSMGTWLPIIDSVAQAARAMPGTTLAQRQARATYLSTQLYNRKRGL